MSEASDKPKMLLIWNEIPEDVKLYVLDRQSHEAELARRSSEFYINGDRIEDNHPICALNDFLATPEAKELEIKTRKGKSLRGKFSEVVVCGMYL